MNAEKALKTALEPIFPDGRAVPHIYTGKALEYVTWNTWTIPEVYAERLPAAARQIAQIHWFLPHGKNPSRGKVAIARALFDAGFSWPDVTNASDEDGQQYVFECTFVNAGAVYGET